MDNNITTITNKVVANKLLDIAKIKYSKGDNKFAVGAYRNAANFVDHLIVPIASVDLINTKGIGPKIAANIQELLTTGKIQFIEENQPCLQSGKVVEELMKIDGIGEKHAVKIYETFHVTKIDDLKNILDQDSFKEIFSDKMILKIKQGIEYLETTKGKIRLDEAISISQKIYTYMKPYVKKIEFCGSLLRSKETIGDIDLVIIPLNSASESLQQFQQMPIVDKVINSGDKKSSVWISGVQFDCYIFDEDTFESGVMFLTGSADHNIRLREIAIGKGYKLSQYGLFKRSNDKRIDDKTQKGIYEKLGFEWIPPEHREGTIEFENYRLGSSVQTLTKDDITCDLHTHSTWSDGTSTVKELVDFAISQGLKTIAITDHSQSLKIANGLSIERLYQRNDEIRRLRRLYPGVQILVGAEVDIKSNGLLDYPDEVLDSLDFVIAAIHSAVAKDVTEMYQTAIRSGKVDVIGHLTGRLINERPEHQMNIETILQDCRTYNVAIELNCQPNRLDANELILHRCKELGIKIAIGSDAHEKNQISFVKQYGLWIGKRAWLTSKDLYF